MKQTTEFNVFCCNARLPTSIGCYSHRPRPVVQIRKYFRPKFFIGGYQVRHRTVFGLIILLSAIFTGAHQAQAGLRFCNQGTFKFRTAVGYVDRQKGWVAKGWLSVEPGECKDALGFRLDNRFYYYFAAGRDDNSLVKYTGGNSFCIETRRFQIYQANYGKGTPEECAKDGLRSEKFRKIDVQGKPEFTVNLGGPDNPPGELTEAPAQPPAEVMEQRAPRQPPAAAAQPPAVTAQPPVVRQQPPPASAVQQQLPAAEPPTASADPSGPRRRQRYNQDPPPAQPAAPPAAAQPAAQGGGPNGAACQRFPNLC
jgi:uncharacterized membrane protein